MKSVPGQNPLEQRSFWRTIFGPTTDRSDYYFVLSVTFLVLLVTSLPYWFAYLIEPEDKEFIGVLLDVPDHLQYFSWMRELTSANLAANKLTPEPNEPVFFNLLWWGLGRIGHAIGFGHQEMFQVLRIFSSIFFLFIIYRFSRLFFSDKFKGRIGFLIVLLTSGLGWILILLKYTVAKGELYYPLDVYIAEGNTFLCIMGYPHFIAAALYIFVIDLVMVAEKKGQYRYAIAAGLFALFLGWQHAYDLISVYGILGIYFVLKLLRDRKIPKFLLISIVLVGLLSFSPALYSVLLTTLDPIWKEVLAQFANAGVYTPNLLHLPILLGLSFVLTIYVVIRRGSQLARQSDMGLLMVGWFLITFFLVYLPVDYQIHLLNGWQVPIGILAAEGLFSSLIPSLEKINVFGKRFFSVGSKVVPLVFLLLISLTNIYLFAWRFIEFARRDYPYYLHRAEIEGLRWLEENGKADDVVISAEIIGQFIPAYTGKRAFIAHWAQTVGYYEKRAIVDEFFSDAASEKFRSDIIDQYSIDFIFYGPSERLLGDVDFGGLDKFSKVFEMDSVNIFKVALK